MCLTDTCRIMASLCSSSSDSESYTLLDDDLQGSDDNLTQSEGLTSDSDDEYLPENDSEASSDDLYESGGDASRTCAGSKCICLVVHNFLISRPPPILHLL